MITRVPSFRRDSRRVTSSPSGAGIIRSRISTCGFRRLTRAIASVPLAASPTTVSVGSVCSRRRSPCLTTTWSSASATVTIQPPGVHESSPLKIGERRPRHLFNSEQQRRPPACSGRCQCGEAGRRACWRHTLWRRITARAGGPATTSGAGIGTVSLAARRAGPRRRGARSPPRWAFRTGGTHFAGTSDSLPSGAPPRVGAFVTSRVGTPPANHSGAVRCAEKPPRLRAGAVRSWGPAT